MVADRTRRVSRVSPRSGKTVVTGGCGFIGAHLCADLVQGGEDVIVVDDLSVGKRGNLEALSVGAAVDVQAIDIRDVASLTRLLRTIRPEKVIHLAAVHFIPKCESDPLNAIRTNVEGTQALLQASAAAGSIHSVTLASSGAVYRPATSAHRETDALGPTDTYGHTKQWAEQLAQLFHVKTGVGVGIARIFNTFGPGETNPHFIPSVILQLMKGNTVQVGTLSTRRDYVYVGDVASGIARLGDVCRERGLLICNIGREEGVEGSRIVELIGSTIGRDVDVVVDQQRVRADDRPVLASDCRLAHSELDWYARTTLEQGLAAALERPLGEGVVLA
jgi:UDP-glucose 4-epimerase